MSALYVYAIVPADENAPSGAAGIDGEPLRAVTEAGLSAIVHDVPSSEPYRGSEDQMRAWVAAHARVVEKAWERSGTVLPVTFDVLVSAADGVGAGERLRAWLRSEAAMLHEKLSELRGMAELKVEIAVDPARLPAQETIEAQRSKLQSRSAGAQRLLERKIAQLEGERAERHAAAIYSEVRRRLASVVQDLVERRRYCPEGSLVPVVCAALLVTRGGVEDVGRVLAEVRDEHPELRIRFLGPWPPYSFADLTPPGGAGLMEAADAPD